MFRKLVGNLAKNESLCICWQCLLVNKRINEGGDISSWIYLQGGVGMALPHVEVDGGN